MATEILRPNGPGSETYIYSENPSGEAHYTLVDDVTPDDASTYVKVPGSVAGWQDDLYALPTHTGNGTINKITVYFRAYGYLYEEHLCFYPDTLVWTEKGEKPISHLAKKDVVLSYNKKTKQIEKTKILLVSTYNNKNILYNISCGKNKIRTTHNQLFFTKRGWKTAENLKIGDILLDTNLKEIPITKIEIEPYKGLVYDIGVERNHNFFANGLLVHNNDNAAKAIIRTHSTKYEGNEETLNDTWTTFSYDWNTNPYTGSAWNWAEIDDLEAGIDLYANGPGSTFTGCTQVYVEIDYTPAKLNAIFFGMNF